MKEIFKKAAKCEEKLLLENIKRVVDIKSVENLGEDGTIFGAGPKLALEEALKIAEEMGFKTKNIDGVIGYAEYGEGEDYVCILGHLDVVPEGEGWSTDPYNMIRKEEKIYGRGVLDNKGPIMASLHALKILKDLDVKLSKKIRIIFGTNEETGFKDIPYYLEKEKPPIMGFTPDCKYPVVYGERGILDFTIWSESLDTSINIEGEFKSNIVPSYIKLRIDGAEIEEWGKPAPGNNPEVGENAITKAFYTLKKMDVERELKIFSRFVVDHFYKKHNLDNFEGVCRDEISGKLVVNPYKIEMKDGKIGLSVVFRYPITFTYDDMITIINSIILEDYNIEINRRMDSVCFPKDSKLILDLKKAYEDVMMEDGSPVTTTGGTYAKVFPNIVAFGPSFPGQKGIAHNKDEWMAVEDLLLNLEIYTHGLYNMAK